MADIAEIKKEELSDMYDFLEHVREYGHIYYFPKEDLDEPFNKIKEGMDKVRKMMDDSFGM